METRFLRLFQELIIFIHKYSTRNSLDEDFLEILKVYDMLRLNLRGKLFHSKQIFARKLSPVNDKISWLSSQFRLSYSHFIFQSEPLFYGELLSGGIRFHLKTFQPNSLDHFVLLRFENQFSTHQQRNQYGIK